VIDAVIDVPWARERFKTARRRTADRWRARGVGAARVLAILLPSRSSRLDKDLGPLVGPLVAVISFVCSVGNIRLRRSSGMAGSASVA
jgi:hypothetical protein